MRRFSRSRAAAGAVLWAAALYGCGGGGGGGGGGRPLGTLTGAVTDVDGQAVAGAEVSVGGNTTTSLTNGTFTLRNVNDGFQTVQAQINIKGATWRGETAVDVVGGEQNRTTNVVVSDERTQGRITGSVIDPSGFALPGAKIFVGGPLASTLAISDNNGNYQVRRLTPGVTYTVTCSLAGYLNDTKTVRVADSQTSTLSFALARGSEQGGIPAPQNVSAQAWTLSDTILRSEDRTKGVYEWLKKLYRRKKGLSEGPLARHIERKMIGRSTPSGAVIEVDLFWKALTVDDLKGSYSDLFGYLIRRGTSAGSLADLAVLRDPLPSVFFDVDPALTPDTTYYYTVHRLDTLGFPARGTVGPASQTVNASPLGLVRANSPAQSETVTGDPVFQWTSVNGAATYQVYVWDRFPDLQNAADPSGVAPVWPADVHSPGSSLVNAPRTSQTYQGPALQSGRTYYWMIVASDSGGGALSATQLAKFVER